MINFKNKIWNMINLLGDTIQLSEQIERAAHEIAENTFLGGKIFIIGNGGSAADANHFAGELLGRFKKERGSIPCISLTADNATITAIANDYGYENIFSRQLEELFDPELDILITLSTSGNSQNIINAINFMNEIGGLSLNLLGKGGGKTIQVNDEVLMNNIVIKANESDTIQEIHKMILHYIAEVVEDYWVKNYNGGVYNK